jgi:hypothetical protein
MNDDILEFLFDSAEKLVTIDDIKLFVSELKEIIIVLPEMFKKIFSYISSLIQKLILKLRFYLITTITNDIDIIDKNQELWVKLNIEKTKNIKILEILSTKTLDFKKKVGYSRIKKFIDLNNKREFLKYLTERGNDREIKIIISELHKIINE